MTIDDDGFLEFYIKQYSNVNEDDMWQSKKEAENYMPGIKFKVLVCGDKYFQVSKEAREVVATKEFSTHVEKVALCSDQIALKLLGNLYIKINKPNVPTKFFTDIKKAEYWLRS